MQKLLNGIQLLLKIVCTVVLLTMVCIVFMQAVSRNVFDYSHAWVEELATMCMVWITFLGAALATSTGSHTRIDLFVRLFPQKITHMFYIVGYLLCGVYSLILVRYGITSAISSINNRSAALKIPTSVNYLGLVTGAVLMILYFVVLIVQEIQTIRALPTQKPEEEGE